MGANNSNAAATRKEAGTDDDEAAVYSEELSPLQKHVAFFDRNKDGIIFPSETYEGFRAIGAGVALSIFSAAFINGFLGPKTRPPGTFPSLYFPIYVRNIKKAKHGSDSGVYDSEGRFVPIKFEEIFQKHAKTNPNALTSDELEDMLHSNRVPKDYKGWLGGLTEWKILYYLCKDKDGLLQKDLIKGLDHHRRIYTSTTDYLIQDKLHFGITLHQGIIIWGA